ncbi:MAG TPA: protein kinase, partial [Melioribacteraceae bacterium]|nr:protein kinase [Melioribacteraceae bacterium]
MDDKTVRGDDNFIPSEMNNDSTVRGNNQIISSGFNTPNVNAAAYDSTVRFDQNGYSDYIGSGMGAPSQTPQGIYILNNKQYKFIKTISVTTGEADIILVEGENGKAVLKIYRDRNKPKLDLIEQLRAIKHDDIIRVYDYGFIPDQFGEKFFELMEFAEGGSVLDCAPINDEKKLKQILKETINAFKFLHEKGIVHCDIKPENLYYRNKNHTDVVIADFGISSIMDTRVKHHITTRKGSDFYIAPEGRQLASLRSNNVKISGAVDYYSLGVTLLVAWMGKSAFEDKIMEIAGIPDKNDYEKLFIAWNDLKEKGAIPFPDNMPERIKNLICGLMVLTEDKRWGYDECTRWLKGEDVPVHKDVVYSDYEPFAFDDDKVAYNPEELAVFMQQDLK